MRPRNRKRHFVLDLFACFLIPVYTLSFAGSTEWFGSNFSVLAVTGRDHYRGFLYWGLLAGSYFFVVVNRLAFSLPGQWLRMAVSWLVLAACLALGYALAIPYLPDYFPRFAALHVGLAAGACALLMLALLVLLLALRRSRPEQYGRLLMAWGLIVLGVCRPVFHLRDGIHRAGGVLYHFHGSAGPETLFGPGAGSVKKEPVKFYVSLI